ncbi:MAG: 3-oxoacyl-ACP synthase III [Desulfatitalea sp.]|nr:3-oxoacyl-ACP synthase III [Desulfatitalea sp.]NNK00777.1 3-oxoacyl-ACP synthase III [Desulfatitalea sp.]
MHYKRVKIAAFGYELAPNVVTSEDLERRLAPVYERLRIQPGQLEALTGIAERRFWDRDFQLSRGAVLAGRKALAASGIDPNDIGMLIYGGVCRENLEPATACVVSHGLDLPADTQVYDVSNACLGVLNGMVQVANAIELGQVRAGLVVSCETARPIVEATIERILAEGSMATFKEALATLTGGSGAVAVVLAADDAVHHGHRLLGAVARNAARHHGLCTWGNVDDAAANLNEIMRTDAVGVLKHGVSLGIETFRAFMRTMAWPDGKPDKVICHQVGAAHQRTILEAIGIDTARDFPTFPYLGNIGSVSLPITAAIAHERQFLAQGDLVGFLGIGSGLNCLFLGIAW